MSRAECTRLMTAAARLPARRLPANSQFVAPDGDRPDLVLDPVVVDRQLAVVEEARQRLPSASGCSRSPWRWPSRRAPSAAAASATGAAHRRSACVLSLPDSPSLVRRRAPAPRARPHTAGRRTSAPARRPGCSWLAHSSWNLRRACAMQPTSVTPELEAGLVAAEVVADQLALPAVVAVPGSPRNSRTCCPPRLSAKSKTTALHRVEAASCSSSTGRPGASCRCPA